MKKIFMRLLISTLIVLVAAQIYQAHFFKTHVFYKLDNIERLTSIPFDEDTEKDIFGHTRQHLISRFQNENDYVFEYVMFIFKLRLESNGSVYFNDELLYRDEAKVRNFLNKYAEKGLFTTSTSTLYFREFLKNKECNPLGQVPLGAANFSISLKFGNQEIFNEWFCTSASDLNYPEAKAVGEIYDELRHFGEDGKELWGLLD